MSTFNSYFGKVMQYIGRISYTFLQLWKTKKTLQICPIQFRKKLSNSINNIIRTIKKSFSIVFYIFEVWPSNKFSIDSIILLILQINSLALSYLDLIVGITIGFLQNCPYNPKNGLHSILSCNIWLNAYSHRYNH